MIAAEIAARHHHKPHVKKEDSIVIEGFEAKHGFLREVNTEVAGLDEAEKEIAQANEKASRLQAKAHHDIEEKIVLPKKKENFFKPEEYWWGKEYLKLAKLSRDTWKSQVFSTYMFVCIGTAGIVVGMQTYPQFMMHPVLEWIDLFILVSFTLEIVLKMIGEGFTPLVYFYNDEWRWNWFDFLIVVFSLPILPFGSGQLKLLRLVRLMRLTKLFKRVPQLNMIMRGLIDSMNFVSYIVLLWFLVIYLYAITGILLFAENDPWHFRSIEHSFVALFQITVMDFWGEIMYVNYYGCEEYPSVFYTIDPAVGTHEIGGLMLCEHPTPAPLMTMLFFVSYVTITAFCIIPLFIGAVTISMADCVVEMKEENKKQHRKRCMNAVDKQIEQLENPSRMDRKMKKTVKLVGMAFTGQNILGDVGKHRSAMQSWLLTKYQDLSDWAAVIIESNNAQSFVTGVIILAGIVVGMQTDKEMNQMYGTYLNVLNDVIQYTFTWELIMKIIAEGEHPYMYFNSSWNNFDFVVVVGSFLPLSSGSMVIILRLLRLFRVLKLMKALPQLQVIITGASKGLSAAFYILLIVTIVYYFFAILANALFAENDPASWGMIHVGMLILWQMATLDNWTTYFYTTIYGCDNQPAPTMFDTDRQCQHPQAHFLMGIIFFAVFTIFGSYVLLALFVGSIGMAMDEANEEQMMEMKIQKRVIRLKNELNLEDRAVSRYHDVFKMIDITETNRIGREELKFGLRVAGEILSDRDFERLWKKVDKDATQDVDFSEFLTFMIDMRELYMEKNAEEIKLVAGNGVFHDDTIPRMSMKEQSISSVVVDKYMSNIHKEEVERESIKNEKKRIKKEKAAAAATVSNVLGKQGLNADGTESQGKPPPITTTNASEGNTNEVKKAAVGESNQQHNNSNSINVRSIGEVEMHDLSNNGSPISNHNENKEDEVKPIVARTPSMESHGYMGMVGRAKVVPTSPVTDDPNTPPRVNNFMGDGSSVYSATDSLVTPVRNFNEAYGRSSPDSAGFYESDEDFERKRAQQHRRKKYHVINVPTGGNRKVKIMAI